MPKLILFQQDGHRLRVVGESCEVGRIHDSVFVDELAHTEVTISKEVTQAKHPLTLGTKIVARHRHYVITADGMILPIPEGYESEVTVIKAGMTDYVNQTAYAYCASFGVTFFALLSDDLDRHWEVKA